MKCPKCGFFGPDSLDTCKKCGKDLSAEKTKLGLTSFRVQVSRPLELIKEEPSSVGTILEESPAPSPQVPKVPDKPKASPQVQKTQIISPRHEPEKKASQKDFGFSPPLAKTESPPQKDFSFETAESDFSLVSEKEEYLPPISVEKDPDTETKKSAVAPPEEVLEDFEFPAALRTGFPKVTASREDDAFSIFSLSEGESEPFELPAAEEKRDSLLPGAEPPPGEELPKEGGIEDEGAKTALLTSEEIENILQSEMSRSREKEKTGNERGETELLDEDEIAKFLASIDHEPPKPDDNPG